MQDGDQGDWNWSVFNEKFGDVVREARERRDWSQRRLAELLDEAGVRLDPSAITRIERGTRDVKLREATAIASVLGIDLAKSLDQIAFTQAQQFHVKTAALADAAVQARRAVAEAPYNLDRIALAVEEINEAKLIKEAGFPGRAEFYTALIRNHPDWKREIVPWFDKEDREIKEAIIDAITDEIFYDEEGPF
jgi:transcriptional regulator with XRE-family HTH domain